VEELRAEPDALGRVWPEVLLLEVLLLAEPPDVLLPAELLLDLELLVPR